MGASVFGALTFVSCRRAVIEAPATKEAKALNDSPPFCCFCFRAVIEALAMGRRVVAFEGGGISEILSVINREVRANASCLCQRQVPKP